MGEEEGGKKGEAKKDSSYILWGVTNVKPIRVG